MKKNKMTPGLLGEIAKYALIVFGIFITFIVAFFIGAYVAMISNSFF